MSGKERARWAAIDKARREPGLLPGDPPAGAFTRREYAQRYGLPVGTARDQLARLVGYGQFGSGRFMGLSGNRRRTAILYYWLLEAKTNG